jgi:hypothetical protein
LLACAPLLLVVGCGEPPQATPPTAPPPKTAAAAASSSVPEAAPTASASAKAPITKALLEQVKASLGAAMSPTKPVPWEEASKMAQSKLGPPAKQEGTYDYWYAAEGSDCYELGLKKSADGKQLVTVQLGTVATCPKQ